MSDKVISTLSFELEADMAKLNKDLEQAEAKAKAVGARMEKSLNVEARVTVEQMGRAGQAIDKSADGLSSASKSLEKSSKSLLTVGKIAAASAALEAGVNAITGAVELTRGLAAGIRGDWEAAAASIEKASASLRSLPVAGAAFGIGGTIGEAIFGDQAEAKRTRERVARNEQARQARIAEVEALQSRHSRIEQGFSRSQGRTNNELEVAQASPDERSLVALDQRMRTRIADLEQQRDNFNEIGEQIGLTASHIADMAPPFDELIAKTQRLGQVQRDELLGGIRERQAAEDKALADRVSARQRERAERERDVRDRIRVLETTDRRQREMAQEQIRLRDELEGASSLQERALLAQESSLRQREIGRDFAPSTQSFSIEEFRRLIPTPGQLQEVKAPETNALLSVIRDRVQQAINNPSGAQFG